MNIIRKVKFWTLIIILLANKKNFNYVHITIVFNVHQWSSFISVTVTGSICNIGNKR